MKKRRGDGARTITTTKSSKSRLEPPQGLQASASRLKPSMNRNLRCSTKIKKYSASKKEANKTGCNHCRIIAKTLGPATYFKSVRATRHAPDRISTRRTLVDANCI